MENLYIIKVSRVMARLSEIFWVGRWGGTCCAAVRVVLMGGDGTVRDRETLAQRGGTAVVASADPCARGYTRRHSSCAR